MSLIFNLQYTGRIVIGAPYNIEEAEELYPKHSWKVNWVSPSQLMKKGPDLPLSEVELTVNPKKAHRDLLTVDHFFTLSPCLSALSLPSNNWSKYSAERTCFWKLTRHSADQRG